MHRATTGGKAAKAWYLAGFGEIENGGSGGAPLTLPLLWRPCLPKLYRGSPEAGSERQK